MIISHYSTVEELDMEGRLLVLIRHFLRPEDAFAMFSPTSRHPSDGTNHFG